MEIKTYRSEQIGGCITELQTKRARIIIDFGEELPDEKRTPAKIYLDGVNEGKPSCDAVLFTHYHSDHVGMLETILPGIPLYMGEVCKRILIAVNDRIGKINKERLESVRTFRKLDKIHFGDIKVTPLEVDHSAYCAYMFLIEADGKRVLHTGDYRSHGQRGKGLIPTLIKYVGKVDSLITEGTMLSRTMENHYDEWSLRSDLSLVFKKYEYVYVLCSSTNIDSIASINSAIPKGKLFITDRYQKSVLDIVTEIGGKESGLYAFEDVKIYGSNLDSYMKKYGFVMLVRATDYFTNIMRKFDLNNAVIVYSMWQGYLDRKAYPFNKFMEGYRTEHLHTSGHAYEDTIRQVIAVTNPDEIIPIHTKHSEWFAKNYPGKVRGTPSVSLMSNMPVEL